MLLSRVILVLQLLANACQAQVFQVQPLTITTTLHTSFNVGTNRVPTAVATNISEKCLQDTEYYVKALYAEKQWAAASKCGITTLFLINF